MIFGIGLAMLLSVIQVIFFGRAPYINETLFDFC